MCDVFRKIHRNDYTISSITEEYHQQNTRPIPKEHQPIVHQLLDSAASMEMALAELLHSESRTLEIILDNYIKPNASEMPIQNITDSDELGELDEVLKSIQLLYSAAQMEADFSNLSEDDNKKIELLFKSFEKPEETALQTTLEDVKEASANLKEIIIAITSIEHDILQKIKTVLALSHL